MSDKFESRSVGDIGNYYGGLWVAEHEGRYWWMIENYDAFPGDFKFYDEIPKYLYDALVKYEEER